MKIETSNFDVLFLSMGSAKPADFLPKKDGDGNPKLSPSGKPLFRASALRAIRMDQDGHPAGEDSSVSLAVEQPASITFGKLYKVSGKTFVTPYVNGDGRLGLSISAETIVPATAQGGER